MKEKTNPAFDRLLSLCPAGPVMVLLHFMLSTMTVSQKMNLLTSQPVADILTASDAALTGRDLVELYENWFIDIEEELEKTDYSIVDTGRGIWYWERDGEASEDFDSREDAIEDAYEHLHLCTLPYLSAVAAQERNQE